MPVELTVPKVGESINEVEIGEWLKAEGDEVARDETLVLLDSAKTTVELPAPVAGRLSRVLKQTGEVALIGEAIAVIEEVGAATGASGAASPVTEAPANGAPASGTVKEPEPARGKSAQDNGGQPRQGDAFVMPAAQHALVEHDLSPGAVAATGPGGRLLKEDVLRHAAGATGVEGQPGEAGAAPPQDQPAAIEHPAPPEATATAATTATAPVAPAASTPQTLPTPPVQATPAAEVEANEEVVPMNMLRRHIAQRLVEAQQTAALLTTFNEVDMTEVMALRKEYQDAFTKKYSTKIGFMSFFVKATIDALKSIPAVNAEIRGKEIIYKNHYDIGVAIGGGKGLVVPVLRNADRMSFADIEKAIGDFAAKVKDNKIAPDDLQGGTFTITNGGIYGSLLSTPIVNPPQSGILGMHSIQERPIALNGQVVIRPMMYIALTYDHRLVDGREAVTFLKRIKDCIEHPTRMLMEI